MRKYMVTNMSIIIFCILFLYTTNPYFMKINQHKNTLRHKIEKFNSLQNSWATELQIFHCATRSTCIDISLFFFLFFSILHLLLQKEGPFFQSTIFCSDGSQANQNQSKGSSLGLGKLSYHFHSNKRTCSNKPTPSLFP